MTAARNPLATDLDRVVAQTPATWEALRGARIFVTGGTGFVGSWLLETLLWANDRLSLGASAVVLTRDRRAFAARAPHLAGHRSVTLTDGDVRTLRNDLGPFTHVVHAAFASGSVVEPQLAFDTLVDGTRAALELAARSGARRFLFTSSGAVYGPQPSGMTHVPEDYAGAPDALDRRSAYGEGKRAAELLCALHADSQLQPAIARCFAFVGPYLPLDAHFAAGNFLRDALRGGPIDVAGDGAPERSYLYAADLAAWLWTILVRGTPLRAYNVGSERAISIADLARTVSRLFTPTLAVRIARTPEPGAPPQRYVPSTGRARTELGLDATVDLEAALARTIQWHRALARPSHG